MFHSDMELLTTFYATFTLQVLLRNIQKQQVMLVFVFVGPWVNMTLDELK